MSARSLIIIEWFWCIYGSPVDLDPMTESQVTKPLARDQIYLKRQFDAEIIVLCVRWYIKDLFSLFDNTIRRLLAAAKESSRAQI